MRGEASWALGDVGGPELDRIVIGGLRAAVALFFLLRVHDVTPAPQRPLPPSMRGAVAASYSRANRLANAETLGALASQAWRS